MAMGKMCLGFEQLVTLVHLACLAAWDHFLAAAAAEAAAVAVAAVGSACPSAAKYC